MFPKKNWKTTRIILLKKAGLLPGYRACLAWSSVGFRFCRWIVHGFGSVGFCRWIIQGFGRQIGRPGVVCGLLGFPPDLKSFRWNSSRLGNLTGEEYTSGCNNATYVSCLVFVETCCIPASVSRRLPLCGNALLWQLATQKRRVGRRENTWDGARHQGFCPVSFHSQIRHKGFFPLESV